MAEETKVTSGRAAVDSYREAHRLLHSKPWHRGIPAEHTPLLITLMEALSAQGFESLAIFFAASREMNVAALGFSSKEDFDTRATDGDRAALEAMWK